MKIIEQHKLISDLKDHTGKMSSSERYDFDMMLKRDKDDEELDALTTAKLEAMHKKFVIRKSKKDIEDLFRKMTSGSDQNKE